MRTVFGYARAVLSAYDWYPVKTAGMCVVGACGMWVCLYFASKHAGIVYCFSVTTPVIVLGAVIRWTLTVPDPPLPPDPPAPVLPPNEDLYFLEYRLSAGRSDPSHYEQRVRPLLARLAEERLVQRHGVDWRRDPDKARAIAGDQLWAVLTGPVGAAGRRVSVREVTALVDRIESL